MYDNCFSKKVKQVKCCGVAQKYMYVQEFTCSPCSTEITFLACDLNVLFSLFKTAFGKRSMSNDKVMYLTATSQARGNGAYVYADIFFHI